MAQSNEIVVTRVLDAPPMLVFKAWTEPERMKHWWGPRGFTLPHCTIDVIQTEMRAVRRTLRFLSQATVIVCESSVTVAATNPEAEERSGADGRPEDCSSRGPATGPSSYAAASPP
jgi:Activator of Hsp90 ATPase homolog 1-like protein